MTYDDKRVYPCPDCAKPMVKIEGKKGPFWGCSDFPRCKGSLYDYHGQPSLQADEDYRCPLCTRAMIKTKGKNGDYWYCTGYNKGCKTTLSDDNGKPVRSYKCGHCGQLLNQRLGKNGAFWGCSDYPTCSQTYSDKQGQPDF